MTPSTAPTSIVHHIADAPVRESIDGTYSRPSLVVSLHDVAPATHEACAAIMAELAGLGIPCASLLVVPHYHHGRHFLEDESFIEWLRERADLGDEMVIHGYYHQRARVAGESILDRAMTRLYTAGEGEFYDIDSKTAEHRYSQARREFMEAGLATEGFIAPAWLLSNSAETALRNHGCSYTTRLRNVLDLQHGKAHSSQSLVWSVRSAWRRQVSLLWNAMLFRRLRRTGLLRISIHPVDRSHGRIWRQIRTLIIRALEIRAPTTYAQWVNLQREQQIRIPTPI